MIRKHSRAASCAALGLTLLSGIAFAATDTSKTAGQAVDDAVVTTRVKAALVGDPTTKARSIDVDTSRGVVRLSGFVDSTEQKSRAAELAGQVEGTKSVRNDLEVRAAPGTAGGALDDATLTAKVKAALVDDPDTKARQIDVKSRSGVVQLSGTVETNAEKDEAARLAGAVKGVQSVDNKLEVK